MDNIKCINIRVIDVTGEEREINRKKYFKNLRTENFPKLMKNINIQIWESQQTTSKINTKKRTFIVTSDKTGESQMKILELSVYR